MSGCWGAFFVAIAGPMCMSISVLIGDAFQPAVRMKNPFRLSLPKPRALTEVQASLIAFSDACAKSSADGITASVCAALALGPVAPRQAPSRRNRAAAGDRAEGAGSRGVCRSLSPGSAVSTRGRLPGCHRPQLESSNDRGGDAVGA